MRKKILLTALACVLFCTAKAQTHDNTFAPFLHGSSEITAMTKQPDDRVLIAGSFIAIGTTYVEGRFVRLNTDGSIDNTFNIGTGANERIFSIALQDDGKIIVGGYFTVFNGQNAKSLIRLHSDGTIDNTFDIGTGPGATFGSTLISKMALQPDGKIIVTGYFESFNGLSRQGIVRLNSDGSVDTDFVTTTGSFSGDIPIALQNDGKIIIGGSFSTVNGVSANRLTRLNSDGTLDVSFNTNMGTGVNNIVHDISLQSDGKIVFIGRFTQVNSATDNVNQIARLNTDGTFDATFINAGFTTTSRLSGVKVLSDNKLIVTGIFASPDKRITKLNADGSVDPAFNPGDGFDHEGPGNINMIKADVQTDGKILAAGVFTHFNGTIRLGLARLEANGSLDTGYKPDPADSPTINDVVTLSDGKSLVAGNFFLVNGLPSPSLIRLNANGTLDNGFTLSGISFYYGEIKAIGIQDDGRIIIGGDFLYTDGGFRYSLARLSASGAYDDTFNGYITDINYSGDGVYTIKVQDDDKIIIGGYFDGINGSDKINFARLNSDGSADINFNPANDYSNTVKNIEIRTSDGKMIVTEGSRSGSVIPYVTLANADGSRLSSFDISAQLNGSYLNDAIFLQDDKILIGGDFTTFNGASAQRLVKVDDAGTRDLNFPNPATYQNYNVQDLSLGNNRIFVGKGAQNFTAQTEGNLLDVLDASGAIIPDMLSVKGNIISSMVPVGSSSFLIGGKFHRVGSTGVTSLMKVDVPAVVAVAPSSLAATPANCLRRISLTWTDNTPSESGFQIQRSTDNNSNFITIGTAEADATSYDDLGPFSASTTTYFYRIRAVNFTSETGFSNEVSAISIPDEVVPGPSGLTVISTVETAIELEWNDNSDVETGFEVFRSTPTTANYVLLHTTSENETSYADNNSLSIGTQYYYKVRANKSGCLSDFSSQVSLTLPTSAPSDLTAIPEGFTQINLTWTDNSSAETGYKVYQVGPSSTELLATLGPDTEAYNVEGLEKNTSYSFLVASFNNTLESVHAGITASTLSAEAGEWGSPVTVTNVPARSSAISFVIGNKAYVGLGRNSTGPLKDLWEFDSENSTWTQKSDFPGTARIGAVAFVINGKGYVGTGNDFNGNGMLRDFYEYDPGTNSWTPIADFPEDFSSAAGITSGAAFSIDNYGYVGLGNTGLNNPTAFFRYDRINNVWEPKANFGGAGRTGAVGFSHNGRGYFAFGYGGLSSNRKDIWEYDPTVDEWIAKTDFLSDGRGGASVFAIQGRAYLCAGTEGDFFSSSSTNKVSEYDVESDTWKEVARFPATERSDAVSFAIGNKGYLFSGENESTYYNDLTIYTPGFILLPAAPGEATASYLSTTSTKVTWTDNADNETEYILEVSLSASPSYTFLVSLPANTNEYTHSGLTPATSYKYKIVSKNSYGPSAEVFTNTIITTPPPVAPSNLEGEALTATTIHLTWTDNSDNETGFTIQWSEDGINFSTLINPTANIEAYTSTGLSPDKTYAYKIAAIGANGPSDFSNVISVRTPDVLPLAPFGLQVLSVSQSEVELGWTDNSVNEAGFKILKKTGSGSFVTLAETEANIISIVDNDVVPGVTYAYRVLAFNPTGESDYIETSVTPTVTDIPEVPTELTAELLEEGLPQMRITWKDNALYEDGFDIIREDLGDLPFASVGENVTSFTDENLIAGLLTYTYRVRSKNFIGSSAYSEPVSITIPPDAVTGIEEQTNIRITFYPNPVRNRFVIANDSEISIPLKIVNMLGANVLSDVLRPRSSKNIDSSEWSAGVYLLYTPDSKPQRIFRK